MMYTCETTCTVRRTPTTINVDFFVMLLGYSLMSTLCVNRCVQTIEGDFPCRVSHFRSLNTEQLHTMKTVFGHLNLNCLQSSS